MKQDKLYQEVKKYVIENYGERCPDYCVSCCKCQMWNSVDILFGCSDGIYKWKKFKVK